MNNLGQQPTAQPASDARITANRQNAQHSSGPKTETGKKRSCLNAKRHGLAARRDSLGNGDDRAQRFFEFCWSQFAPKNALEANELSKLLVSRLWGDRFIEVEREALTRRPISQTLSEEAYPILNDQKSVQILSQIARHFTHNSRCFEKSVLALILLRQEKWKPYQKPPTPPPVSNELKPDVSNTSENMTDIPPVHRGTLQDLLADGRLIFPEEDADEFAALAQELWDTFQPSDLLESLVVVDYILAQWRLDRLNHLQNIYFERLSTSASATNCGPGFAYISDYQSNQALEPLCQYEGALRKHQERRMSLFRKLRSDSKPSKNAANFPAPESTADQPVAPVATQATTTMKYSPTAQDEQIKTDLKSEEPAAIGQHNLVTSVGSQQPIVDSTHPPTTHNDTRKFPEQTSNKLMTK